MGQLSPDNFFRAGELFRFSTGQLSRLFRFTPLLARISSGTSSAPVWEKPWNRSSPMSSRLDVITDWEDRAKRANYRVSELAAQCGITERQLRRYFLLKFRCSPHAWLSGRRIELVRPLLDSGKLIKEMAAVAGFSQASNFSRQFKRYYQNPPSKLRGTPSQSCSSDFDKQ
jgi:transcriptional regulator GlxA family with amidase domain